MVSSNLKFQDITIALPIALMLAMVLSACSSSSDDSSPAVVDDGSTNSTPEVNSASETLSIANAESILANVVSVINEDAIEALYQTAIDDQLFLNPGDPQLFVQKLFFNGGNSDNIQSVSEGMLDVPYQMELTYGQENYVDVNQTAEYSCVGGGSLTRFISDANQASDWLFDDCVIASNTYNGTVGDRLMARGAVNRSPVYDLTIEDSSGQVRSLSGSYSSHNSSVVAIDSELMWESANYLGPAEGGQLQIDDYSVSRSRRDDKFWFEPDTLSLPDGQIVETMEYSVANAISGTFTVTAPWTQNESLAITVNVSFEDDARVARIPETEDEVEFIDSDPEDAPYWQTGSINITAADGSQFQVAPVEGQRGNYLVTADNGETFGPVPVELKMRN